MTMGTHIWRYKIDVSNLQWFEHLGNPRVSKCFRSKILLGPFTMENLYFSSWRIEQPHGFPWAEGKLTGYWAHFFGKRISTHLNGDWVANPKIKKWTESRPRSDCKQRGLVTWLRFFLCFEFWNVWLALKLRNNRIKWNIESKKASCLGYP